MLSIHLTAVPSTAYDDLRIYYVHPHSNKYTALLQLSTLHDLLWLLGILDDALCLNPCFVSSNRPRAVNLES